MWWWRVSPLWKRWKAGHYNMCSLPSLPGSTAGCVNLDDACTVIELETSWLCLCGDGHNIETPSSPRQVATTIRPMDVVKQKWVWSNNEFVQFFLQVATAWTGGPWFQSTWVNDDYAQLRSFGFIYPVGDLLRFGTKACALCKLWHHSYEQWTDIREPVLVLGPDACSTLTITNYFVQAAETGRYFITDDIITPDFAATYDAFSGSIFKWATALAAAAPQPIPVDDSGWCNLSTRTWSPAGLGLNPARRLRGKTSPVMLNRLWCQHRSHVGKWFLMCSKILAE